jgi:hypothetical protein
LSKATPRIRALSRGIFQRTLADAPHPDDVAASLDRTFGQLHDVMQTLIGPEGYRALLERALFLARGEFAWTASLKIDRGRTLSLQGAREIVASEGPEVATEGFVLVLANFIGLLHTFIGEDLTMRLLSRIWPDIPETDTRGDTKAGP